MNIKFLQASIQVVAIFLFLCINLYIVWIINLKNIHSYKNNGSKINKRRIGTSALNPGAGFLRIFRVAFDMLG